MFLKNCFLLVLISLGLASCAEVDKSRYKDTSHLEKPPEFEILETSKVNVVIDEVDDKI